MRKHLQVLLPIVLLAAISFVSIQAGIIQAIIPAAAPTANKRGASNVFQLAADNTTAAAGTAFCDDGSGNTTTVGCNVASSSAFSAITSGTNTKAGMVVGAGATLATASTGTLFANGIRPYTVATLPVSPGTGMQAYVTDGINTLDCTNGLGAFTVLCGWTGSAWIPESGAGAAFLSGATDPGVSAVPTIVQSRSVDSGASGTSLAFSSSIAAGNFGIAALMCAGNPTGISVTDTLGTSYTVKTGAFASPYSTYLYSGKFPTAGANTITFTAGGSFGCGFAIAEMAGSNGVVDVSASGAIASAVTTVTTNDLIVAATMLGGFASTAIPPTVTLETIHDGGNNQMLLKLPTGAPGSYSVATTGSWNAISVVAFQPTPVPSPGITGSFYINTTTGVLWGPKTGAGWSQSGLSLISTTGANNQLVLGVVPVSVTSCGTSPSIVTGSTNTAGTINIGSGVTVTACTLNFGTPTFTNAPSCRVNTNSTVSIGDVSSVSTSAVTFSLSATLGGGQLYYSCF